MNAGDFFVNLGVKGADKTIGQLTDVQKGMGELGSMALESKASIVAAIYAVEQLFSKSGKLGTNLANFSVLTGISTKTLQQWQYGMIQAGGSADEMTANFKSVQQSMAQIALMGAPPKHFAQMAKLIGDPDLWKNKLNTEYMMNAYVKGLRVASKSPEAKAIMNEVAKSLGLTEGFIVSARKGTLNPEALAKAPTYSKNEIDQLDKANIGWSNLGLTIERMAGRMNARRGQRLVKDITGMVKPITELVENLDKLIERFGLLEKATKFMTGIGNIFKLINESLEKYAGGKESKKGDLLYTEPGQEAVPGFSTSPFMQLIKSIELPSGNPGVNGKTKEPETEFPTPWSGVKDIPMPKHSIAPSVSHHMVNNKSEGDKNITFHQALHFSHPGTDHGKVAAAAKTGAKEGVKEDFRRNYSALQHN